MGVVVGPHSFFFLVFGPSFSLAPFPSSPLLLVHNGWRYVLALDCGTPPRRVGWAAQGAAAPAAARRLTAVPPPLPPPSGNAQKSAIARAKNAEKTKKGAGERERQREGEKGEGGNRDGGGRPTPTDGRDCTPPPSSPTPPPGSQLKNNAASQTLVCQVCRSTFICTSTEAKLKEHTTSKHAKHTFEQCFPEFGK